MKFVFTKLALLAVLFSPALFADSHSGVAVKVNGMVCAFCAKSIEKKFGNLDEVSGVKVDLDSKVVKVFFKPGRTLSDEVVETMVKDSGYAVSAVEPIHDKE